MEVVVAGEPELRPARKVRLEQMRGGLRRVLFEILTWMFPVPPSATVFPAWSTLLSLVLNGFVASAAVPMPRSVRFCRLVMATTPAAQAVPLK